MSGSVSSSCTNKPLNVSAMLSLIWAHPGSEDVAVALAFGVRLHLQIQIVDDRLQIDLHGRRGFLRELDVFTHTAGKQSNARPLLGSAVAGYDEGERSGHRP